MKKYIKQSAAGSAFARIRNQSAFVALTGLSALFAQTAVASALGDGIRQLGAGDSLKRSVALRDLGITAPVVLAGTASQDFYLPVPYGVPLMDASIAFEGRYLKGEPGATSMVLSLNGVPSVSQMIPDGDGAVQRALAVSQPSRAENFVRLGVNLHNKIGVRRCEEDQSLANSITISPQTRLNYRINEEGVRSIGDVWSALPSNVSVLVVGQSLEKTSFDSAWRIGTSVLRGGKRLTVRALPAVGDVIDTREVNVPATLASSPVFAVFKASATPLKIANSAQLGALMVLGAPQVYGDIVVADKAMQQQVAAALDALQAQLTGDADASEALKQWRVKRMPVASEALASKQIRVLPMGRQLALGVAADAGTQLAGLQEAGLQRLLTSSTVTVAAAQPADWDEKKGIRLTSLGAVGDSFDVFAKGEWTVNFPLSAVSTQGKMPSEVTLFIAAAPGASTTKPVATVYWNGALLVAKQLDADGHPERLTARIPSYALGVNNTLRVSVQRQPYSADCNELPQAYPASVLPAFSYVTPGDVHPDGTFVGLLPLLAAKSQLLVPDVYLAASPASVERIASITAASGLSASQAELVIAKADASVKPSKPFVSMDVALADAKPQVTVTGGRQLQIRGKEVSWLDITGLKQLASVEVVKSGGQPGVLWHAIGEWTRGVNEPFLLNRGDVAVIGNDGPLAWLDSSNPDANIPADVRRSPLYEWRQYMSWGVPAIVLGLLLLALLFLVAWRVSRKHRTHD